MKGTTSNLPQNQMLLSGRFLVVSFLGCCFFSFAIGSLARTFLLQESTISPVLKNKGIVPDDTSVFLPMPTVKDKIVPTTIYTGKTFDTRSSVINSQWLKKPEPLDDVKAPQNEKLTSIHNETDYEYDADDEEHLPAGQHLLVDIDGVDAKFLNSEKELATAMIEMVDSSGLTLLSYHCHGLKPAGVTCVGVLLESHVSFHTWPVEGVITLDLFTCGANSLLNHLDLIQRVFAVPRRNVDEPEDPTVLWAYKRRGFNEQSGNAGSRDAFAYPLGIHGYELKKEIANVVTDHGKQGWIYDMQRSIRGTEDSGRPTRLFYLDGVLKATSDASSASHESFVHPAMLSHDNPKQVLTIGSTTGATVKEILKYPSVDQVSLVGVDETLLAFSETNLATWNDCSDIVPSSQANCLRDARVRTVYENPNQWVRDRSHLAESAKFDVVLLDLFDLEEEVSEEILSGGLSFWSSLKSLMSEEGVLVINIARNLRSVDSQASSQRVSSLGDPVPRILAELYSMEMLSKEYSENQGGFPEARRYVVAFASPETARNWNRNEAQVNHEIRKRSLASRSGAPAFEFFDGAIMASYSKYEQGIEGCEDHPLPHWCGMKAQADKPGIGASNLTGEGHKVEGIVLQKKRQHQLSNNSLLEDAECGNPVDTQETELVKERAEPGLHARQES